MSKNEINHKICNTHARRSKYIQGGTCIGKIKSSQVIVEIHGEKNLK